MSPDPALTLDGRQLAIWEQTVAAADMRGLDPPAAQGWVQGIAPALPDGSYVVAPQSFFAQGAVGDDAVWVRNALVQASQFSGGFQGAVVRLMPTTYTFNTTCIGNEFQHVIGSGMGSTIVKLGVTGIPAFQWTNRIAVANQLGTGGLLSPGLTVQGVSGTPSPGDGSIGVQMADIVRLQCRVQVINCQTGLLMSNQNFFTEQGEMWINSQGCANPVIMQVAASGGAGRTGSFDRTQMTVVHNETCSGTFGLGGVQLLNGAQFLGGYLRQLGNFSGTGQAGMYATYVNGTFGGTASYLQAAELTAWLEWDGSGTAPGSLFIGSGNIINAYGGGLYYGQSWGTNASITGTFIYNGQLLAQPAAAALQQGFSFGSITSGFPAGVSGSVGYRVTGNMSDAVILESLLSAAATTTINNGATLFTMPANFRPAATAQYIELIYNPFGSTSSTIVAVVASSGAVTLASASFTTPGGGASTIRGTPTYLLGF